MTAPFLPARYTITTAEGEDDADLFPMLIGQSFILSKRPIWKTKTSEATSGRQRRRKLWSAPKWGFKIAFEVLRQGLHQGVYARDLERLTNFFLTHSGGFSEFFFFDPGDNEIIANRFGTGDGTTRAFQLTRERAFGAVTYNEPVHALLGQPTVFVNGAAVETFTVGDRGLLTFATPPASGAVLTWSGRFLFACTLNDDELDAQQLMQGLWSQQGVEFTTVKR